MKSRKIVVVLVLLAVSIVLLTRMTSYFEPNIMAVSEKVGLPVESWKKTIRFGATAADVTTRPLSEVEKTSNDDDVIRNRFRARQLLVTCDHAPRVSRPFYTYEGNEHFNVCLLRKVGSSFFRSYTKLVQRNDTETKRAADLHAPSNTNTTTTTTTTKLAPTTKLVIVRDPYSRLTSGYIDKCVTNPDGFRLAPTSRRKVWSDKGLLEFQIKCDPVMTFQQFVKYFIAIGKKNSGLDNHFKPMSAQCNPCQTKFDYIVHMETLDEDVAYIFRTLDIGSHRKAQNLTASVTKRVAAFEKAMSEANSRQYLCSAYRLLWWAYQARGFMSREIGFPLNDALCNFTPHQEFTTLILNASKQSLNGFDKSGQKRRMMVELYLQLSLEDRLEIRNILAQDFQLFGYDPLPSDIFPELFKAPKYWQ